MTSEQNEGEKVKNKLNKIFKRYYVNKPKCRFCNKVFFDKDEMLTPWRREFVCENCITNYLYEKKYPYRILPHGEFVYLDENNNFIYYAKFETGLIGLNEHDLATINSDISAKNLQKYNKLYEEYFKELMKEKSLRE